MHGKKTCGGGIVTRRLVVLGLLAGPLAACSDSLRPVLESNKDADYKQKLTRVLVVAGLLLIGRESQVISLTELKRSMTEKWAAYGVTVDLVDGMPSAQGGPSTRIEAMKTFQPAQVLEIQTASKMTLLGQTTNISFDCSVIDVASKKRIWRATLALKGRFDAKIFKIPPDKAADEIVDALTQKLRSDGLL